jgi:hypothetical protein
MKLTIRGCIKKSTGFQHPDEFQQKLWGSETGLLMSYALPLTTPKTPHSHSQTAMRATTLRSNDVLARFVKNNCSAG